MSHVSYHLTPDFSYFPKNFVYSFIFDINANLVTTKMLGMFSHKRCGKTVLKFKVAYFDVFFAKVPKIKKYHI